MDTHGLPVQIIARFQPEQIEQVIYQGGHIRQLTVSTQQKIQLPFVQPSDFEDIIQ